MQAASPKQSNASILDIVRHRFVTRDDARLRQTSCRSLLFGELLYLDTQHQLRQLIAHAIPPSFHSHAVTALRECYRSTGYGSS
jgi:hypothetical protein